MLAPGGYSAAVPGIVTGVTGGAAPGTVNRKFGSAKSTFGIALIFRLGPEGQVVGRDGVHLPAGHI